MSREAELQRKRAEEAVAFMKQEIANAPDDKDLKMLMIENGLASASMMALFEIAAQLTELKPRFVEIVSDSNQSVFDVNDVNLITTYGEENACRIFLKHELDENAFIRVGGTLDEVCKKLGIKREVIDAKE